MFLESMEFRDAIHSYMFDAQKGYSGLSVEKSRLGNFQGLFSCQYFRKGAVICRYEGSVLNTLSAFRLTDKSYLMRLGEQKYIDNREYLHMLARYINDCINPIGHNVKFEKHPELNCAVIVATRDIFPGEELYADYGKWYWIGATIKPYRLSLTEIHVDTELKRLEYEKQIKNHRTQ